MLYALHSTALAQIECGDAYHTVEYQLVARNVAVTIKIATYPEGNLAIKLYQESFGQLIFWDSLTVNP